MSQRIEVTLPLFVDLARKRSKPKRVYLSRNVWDNLHFQARNQVKTAVHELVNRQLDDMVPVLKLRSPVSVHMVLYPSRATSDLGNFCDVIGKIAQDAVVRYGLVEDDNVKYIKSEHREYGGTDVTNPRIIITYKGSQS